MKFVNGAALCLLLAAAATQQAYGQDNPSFTRKSQVPAINFSGLSTHNIEKFLNVGLMHKGSNGDAINCQNGEFGADLEVVSTGGTSAKGASYPNLDSIFDQRWEYNGGRHKYVKYNWEQSSMQCAPIEGYDFSGNMALTSSGGQISLSNTDVYASVTWDGIDMDDETGILSENSGNTCQSVSNADYYPVKDKNSAKHCLEEDSASGLMLGTSDCVYKPGNSRVSCISGCNGDGVGIQRGVDMSALRDDLDAWMSAIKSWDVEYTYNGPKDLSSWQKKDGDHPLIIEMRKGNNACSSAKPGDTVSCLEDRNEDGIIVVDIEGEVNGNDWKIENSDVVFVGPPDVTVVFRLKYGKKKFLVDNTSIQRCGPGQPIMFALGIEHDHTGGEEVLNANNALFNNIVFWEMKGDSDDYGTNVVNCQNCQGCAQFIGDQVLHSNSRFMKCAWGGYDAAPPPENKQDGEVCKVTRHGNSYHAVEGWECDVDGGLECGDVEDDGGDGIYEGICGPIECTGKANVDKPHPHDDQATDRVTICHRTCSPTNPWVRITIDKDAWGTTYHGDEDNGTSGCGHKLQHDVLEDCNRDDYTPWAPWFKDYLIKDHGKKDGDYGETYNNAYWREWEPACPYVRNGACCDPDTWVDRGDGVMVTNCCGVAPPTANPTPEPTPQPTPAPLPCAIDMVKTSTTSSVCTGNMGSAKGANDLATGQPSTDFRYCYEIKNTGQCCLALQDLEDDASVSTDGGSSGLKSKVMASTSGMPNGCLAPGDSVMVAGDPFTCSSASSFECNDGSKETTTGKVTGTGYEPNSTPNSVTASDPAGVEIYTTPSPTANPTPQPTEEPVVPDATPVPVGCPAMTDTRSTKCPGSDIMEVLESQGQPLPGDAIYDIQFLPDSGAHGEVSFKVDNPFVENADIYVEFHQQVGVRGAFDVLCDDFLNIPGCNPGADTIKGACIERNGRKFSIVNVYYVSQESSFLATPAFVEVPECCEYYDHNDSSYQIAKYTFEIECECPTH